MKIDSLPWVVFGISMLISTIVFSIFLVEKSIHDEKEFQTITENFEKRILVKIETSEQILMGFKAFFAGSEKVEPDEFESFFKIQNIENRFPEIQGIGFIEYIIDEDRKNVINQEWEKLGLDYRIHPEGVREEYFPVTLLQPVNYRNERAIGYDINTEKIRQDAIENAILTREQTVTGKIILVQETEEDVQFGFLILLPVHDIDKTSENYGELLGFIYSVYRMNDFIEGIFVPTDVEHLRHVQMQIYDNIKAEENLFFDSGNLQSFEGGKHFVDIKTISFGNRDWVLSFQGETTHGTSLIELAGVGMLDYGLSILFTYVTILLTKNIQLSRKITKKEKIAVIGEISSRLAHDIRNPLSNIRMSIELLQKEKVINENQEFFNKCNIIQKNVDRISHQVDNVLDFVRSRPIEKKDMSVKECISEGIQEAKIPNNIKVILVGDYQTIQGDPIQLEIVFRNLLINSIQAIGKKLGTIKITINDEGDFLKIVFEDSAQMLSQDQIENIFEPLSTTKEKGTGLGLVSCKQIVESHGGEIFAKADPTRFIIKLPKQ